MPLGLIHRPDCFRLPPFVGTLDAWPTKRGHCNIISYGKPNPTHLGWMHFENDLKLLSSLAFVVFKILAPGSCRANASLEA